MLQQYQEATLVQLSVLKQQVLRKLLNHQRKGKRYLQYYRIALQYHVNNIPHLDILLVYQKSIRRRLTDFDYLFKHGNITTYRKLNEAIIDYGKKQDKQNLHNFPEDLSGILNLQQLKSDPYRYLELQMRKDPLNFSLEQYCQKHDLAHLITGWSGIKTKLKDMQIAAANLKLKQKPGFRLITRELARQKLPSRLYAKYTKNKQLYKPIVEKLNQIRTDKFDRPFKSKQLFLVGPPDTGKTSLVREIQKYCSVYHMDVSNWFPRYQNRVYPLIFWDQFKLKGSMSHTDLLKFLQGSPMDLQYKGGSTLRNQNQLIIMTSNLSLERHVEIKFKDLQLRQEALRNLRTRILEIQIPEGLDLFLLQDLIVPVEL